MSTPNAQGLESRVKRDSAAAYAVCGARCSSLRGYAVHGATKRHLSPIYSPSPSPSPSPLPTLTHSLALPCPISFCQEKPQPPVMEKKDSVAIVASKAAGEEAPVLIQAPVPVPVQAPAPAAEAAVVPVQAPVPVPAWNP